MSDNEIVVRDDQAPAPIFGMLPDEAIEQAEKSVANINRIKTVALKVTTPGDWENLGGKMYLKEAGTMKVANLFGVSFGKPEVVRAEHTIDGQQVVTFTAELTATFNGRDVSVEGVSSSKDRFFSQSRGRQLPLSEIDLPSVRKKALTNAFQRATKKILGLDNVSPQEMQGVHRVEYKQRPPQESAPQAQAPQSPPPAQSPQQGAGGGGLGGDRSPEPQQPQSHEAVPQGKKHIDDAIWELLMTLGFGDEGNALNELEIYTAWENEKTGQKGRGTRDFERVKGYKPFAKKKLVEKLQAAADQQAANFKAAGRIDDE
jgi:hypothetical protein